MTRKLVYGCAWLVVAMWAVAAFTEPSIVPADCGSQPSWSDTDAWYDYGDCSGDYGPIDQAGEQ